tara:strand:- start:79 stop:1326 length:1248 start_codon:yes stop_codon:yes gene_type:complete
MKSTLRLQSPMPDIVDTRFGSAYDGTANGWTMADHTDDSNYRTIGEYVKKLLIEVAYLTSLDYSEVSLPDPTDPLLGITQSRVEGIDKEKLKDFENRFNSGEKIVLAPICIPIGGRDYVLVGNHRVYGKKNSESPAGPMYILDPNNKLTQEEKIAVAKYISAMGNAKTNKDKDCDTLDDIKSHARKAWEAIQNVNLNDTSPIFAEAISIKEGYDASLKKEEYCREWVDTWMDENKPGSYTTTGYRTRIYNAIFESGHGQPIREYEDSEIKNLFESYFTNEKFDITENDFASDRSLYQMDTEWHTEPTQTIERRLKDVIWRLEPEAKTRDAHVVIRGVKAGVRTTVTRNKGIEKVIQDLNGFNNHALHNRWGLPIIRKVLFPQALRDCDDRTYAYEWSASTRPPSFKKVSNKGSGE